MPNYNSPQSTAMPPGVPNQPGVGYKPSSMSNQYPGYNHYRQPSNPGYNYDANNANWNDRKYCLSSGPNRNCSLLSWIEIANFHTSICLL